MANVGGSDGVRGFNGGCGGFGGLLVCAAVHCRAVTHMLACWSGQRQRQRDGGSGCLSSFLPGLTVGVRAWEMGSRQQRV
jgi:hypothetical protein